VGVWSVSQAVASRYDEEVIVELFGVAALIGTGWFLSAAVFAVVIGRSITMRDRVR
jgi:hypothetical protein